MGGAYSVPTDTKTPTVLNFILREMFSRADLVDIYSLADPNRCSKYIVVAADALETLFVKIRLEPAATKEGTLYFQSIEGLAKGTSVAAVDAQAKQRLYCKQIAFFFVRIFQTFAALTLTILDSELPAVDPSDTLPDEVRQQRRATFIDPKSFLSVTQAAAKQRGGALSENFRIKLPPYSILNEYLTDRFQDTASTQPLEFKDSIVVSQQSLYDFDAAGKRMPKAAGTLIPEFIYVLRRGDSSGRGEYSIKAKVEMVGDTSNFRVTMSDFETDYPSPKTTTRQLPQTADFERNYTGGYSSRSGVIGRPNISFSDFIKVVFQNVEMILIGSAPVNLVRQLTEWNLLEPTERASTFRISGTKLFFSSPERGADLSLFYTDTVKIPGESGSLKVVIDKIVLRLENVVTGASTKKYRFKLDLTKAVTRTTPAGFDYLINTDRIFSPKDFILSSSRYGGQPYTDEVKPRSLTTWLNDKMEEITKNKEEETADGTGIRFTRQGLPIPHDSDNIPEEFRIKALWKALAKDPPIKSHCVARATQLLSVAAIRGKIDETTFTQACRTTFAYQKDGSLPVPGQSIFKSAKDAAGESKFQGEYGILALATLFIERLGANGVPQLADTKKYKTFLANLKYAFEKTAKVDEANPPARLKDIREVMPGGVCERDPDKRLLVPAGLAGNLQGVTRELMSRQVQHVGQAMNLIFELFDRDAVLNKRTFALNANILKGGTPAVNTVAAKARELLLKYYVDCETTYRRGLTFIVDADRRTPLVPVGGTGAT
jgi:hypothetical protein